MFSAWHSWINNANIVVSDIGLEISFNSKSAGRQLAFFNAAHLTYALRRRQAVWMDVAAVNVSLTTRIRYILSLGAIGAFWPVFTQVLYKGQRRSISYSGFNFQLDLYPKIAGNARLILLRINFRSSVNCFKEMEYLVKWAVRLCEVPHGLLSQYGLCVIKLWINFSFCDFSEF